MKIRTAAGSGLLLAFALFAAPAQAVEPTSPEVRLVEQSPTTGLGQDFRFAVRTSDAGANANLRTTVYDRITTRSAFDRALDGRTFGAVLSRVATPLTAPDQTVVLPLAGSETPGPQLNVTQVGVYPVRIELLVDGAPVGTGVTTFLLTVPTGDLPIRETLAVATIVPVVDSPAFRADGSPEPAAIAAREADGRLGRLARGLAAKPETPITMQLGGETLASWATLARERPTLAATLEQLRTAAAAHQRIADTFVPVDAPSLRAAGLEVAVRDEIAAGFDAAGAAIGRRIDARTAAPNPVDIETLDLLGARGIDQVILDPAALRPMDARLTPARPFLVDGSSRQFRAAISDPGLSQAAVGPNGPVANAQRVLAGLTLVALEAPNTRRGVAVRLPSDLDAPAGFYETLLGALVGHPFLRPVTVDALLNDVPLDATTAGPLMRTLAPATPTPVNITAAELDRSRQRAAALASLAPADDPAVLRARDALLIAPTSQWTGADGRRRATEELTAVDASITAAARAIRAPQNRTFQLTGKHDRIPLTFVNASDAAVDVRIALEGSRIGFPNEQLVHLPANKSTTVSVLVEPRTSGTYPFILTMRTSEGGVVLARNRLTVNASSVTGVGTFIAIGAGVFLAAWWGHYAWKRRRRSNTPEPTLTSEPAEQPA